MASAELLHQPHDHQLQYLLKTDNEGYFVGRVLQLPAVIVQGTTATEVEGKIKKATQTYLQNFEDDHVRVFEDASSQLRDSGQGIIVGTKDFIIKC